MRNLNSNSITDMTHNIKLHVYANSTFEQHHENIVKIEIERFAYTVDKQ